MSDRRRRHLEPAAPLPVAVVIVYKSLGTLLPERYDPDRRSLRYTSRKMSRFFQILNTRWSTMESSKHSSQTGSDPMKEDTHTQAELSEFSTYHVYAVYHALCSETNLHINKKNMFKCAIIFTGIDCNGESYLCVCV